MNRLRGLCHRCGHVHKFPDDPDCAQVCVECALAAMERRRYVAARAFPRRVDYWEAAMWNAATCRAWRVV